MNSCGNATKSLQIRIANSHRSSWPPISQSSQRGRMFEFAAENCSIGQNETPVAARRHQHPASVLSAVGTTRKNGPPDESCGPWKNASMNRRSALMMTGFLFAGPRSVRARSNSGVSREQRSLGEAAKNMSRVVERVQPGSETARLCQDLAGACATSRTVPLARTQAAVDSCCRIARLQISTVDRTLLQTFQTAARNYILHCG